MSNNTTSSSTFTGYMVDQNILESKTIDYSNIYRSQAFTEAMNYFDNTDEMTRKVLLTVNESDQNGVLVALSNKLYKQIVDKVDEIDFGTIPKSAGDFTKIDNYETLVDCVKTIKDILGQYNQNTKNNIDIVLESITHMENNKDIFTKAYTLNVELPIIIYNTIALSIVSSIGYMITSCIEFVKNPNSDTFDVAVDKVALKHTSQSLLFKDLAKFNNFCSSGNFRKTMEFTINKTSNNLVGDSFGVASIAWILGLILIIIPVIRELIYFFYFSRFSISNFFDAQYALLKMNSYNIEINKDMDKKKRKEIVAKQNKIAELFKKVSNITKVEMKTGEGKTTKEISKLDKEKFKQSDVLDDIPDSSKSILF